jgi:hypothetical protein
MVIDKTPGCCCLVEIERCTSHIEVLLAVNLYAAERERVVSTWVVTVLLRRRLTWPTNGTSSTVHSVRDVDDGMRPGDDFQSNLSLTTRVISKSRSEPSGIAI